MNADFKLNGLCLETERLILRAFRQEDLRDLNEYASVEGLGEMAGWKHHESLEESQKILDIFMEQDKTFAIVFKESGKLIGSLGVEEYGLEGALSEFFPYRGRELGFALSNAFWGKAIMQEAVNAVIDHLFGVCELDFLLCGHYDFNRRSKRLQEKCGFRPYRKLVMDTAMGTQEPGVLSLLLNPDKKIRLNFSHPETLIYSDD